jgi:hypothetical protein
MAPSPSSVTPSGQRWAPAISARDKRVPGQPLAGVKWKGIDRPSESQAWHRPTSALKHLKSANEITAGGGFGITTEDPADRRHDKET